ncbi:MAG: cytochrome c maturation protein CcmE [Alphaproteobacteria bacterium]|nr:cytochrome c maturation protein CcmE [Alphaproteobacteria bacterium]
MRWKPKHRRLFLVLASLGLLSSGVGLMLLAFQDGLVFFYTPSELHQPKNLSKITADRVVRVGGMVAEKSLQRTQDGLSYRFVITDMSDQLAVAYTGVLPDLFREGQGVVAEGHLQPDGTLVATNVLAKHDERYMPKNMVDQLKKSGRWQEYEGQNSAYGQKGETKLYQR